MSKKKNLLVDDYLESDLSAVIYNLRMEAANLSLSDDTRNFLQDQSNRIQKAILKWKTEKGV